MTRQSFPFVLLFSFVIVSYLVINQYQSAPLTKNFNTDSINFVSQRKKFSSLINRTENIVRRFRCLKGWKQFGGKCYHPSIITSSVDKANEKCNLLYGNTTHLMRIEHSAELSYAAYQCIKHDLTTLLVEVDPQVLKSQKFIDMILKNDQVEWKTMEENLAQVQNNFEDQIKLSNSTNINQNDSFDENDNDFDPFNNISGLCHQFAWSVTNTNSRFLTFSTYKIGDKLICSLSDIDMNINYEHLCQYVLDICFANIICGTNGRCVNYLQAFKCSCSLFFDGNRCEKFSYQILEMFIVLFLILFVIIWRLSKLLRSFITWIINKGVGSAIKIRNVSSATSWSWQRLKKELEKKRFIRSRLAIILTLIICFVLFYISTIFQMDSLKLELEIDKVLSKSNECKPEYFSFLRKEDGFSVIISIVLLIIYSLCLLFEKRKKKKKESSNVNRPQNSTDIELSNRNGDNPETVPFINDEAPGENSNPSNVTSNREDRNAENQPVLNNHSVIPYHETKSLNEYFYPMAIYGYVNRYETSAIFGILTFEILKMFDELLIAKSGSSDDGVIRITFKRLSLVFLVGIRYYPSFISLGLKNLIVRCLTLIHILIIIIYTIYRESFCLDFMPQSQNFSIIDEFQFLTGRKQSFIIYGVIANVPYFLLLSYIFIEFGMRFIFDPLYKSELKKEKEDEKERKEKKQKKKKKVQNPSEQSETSDNRSFLKKNCDWIYKWDENFRYSTIVLSTYLVNYIILFHLTCSFSFLYTTRKMNSLSFIKNILEKILYIEIKDQLYSAEVIFAAILTGLIYTLQLFMAMKNFRKQLKKYRGKSRKLLIEETGIKTNEARSKAIQYPGYVIRYTVGGFVITFHILLFITLIPRQIYFHLYSLKWILGSILPIILLYIMQLAIAKSISKFIDSRHETNVDVNNTQTKESDKDKIILGIKNILQYFILVANCLIGILSSIIRLIIGFTLNIIYINRIDFSLYEEPFELKDSAYVAYWSFIYEQIPYIDHQPNDEPEQIENLSKPSDDIKKPDGDSIPGIIAEEIIDSSGTTDGIEQSILNSSEIDEQLLNIGLRRIQIIGDGNCFFRAILHQLNKDQAGHLDIRLEATNYIRSHPNEFEPSIVGNIEEIEKDGTYAEHPIILATARHMKIIIFIHERGKNPLLILGTYYTERQVHVTYDPFRQHYESICTLDGRRPILMSGTFQLT